MPNSGGGDWVVARLEQNTDPISGLGLKFGGAFTVSAKFDLTALPKGSYGLQLNDATTTHAGDQVEQLLVQGHNDGSTVVGLYQINPSGNQLIASQTLTAAELSGNNQIELDLTHAANSNQLSGSFELLHQGSVGESISFAQQSAVFTNNVNWARAEVVAYSGPTVLLSLSPGQAPQVGQTLTASATANDSDATLHYQWQNSANSGQTWSNVADATNASYTVQGSDIGDNLRVVATTSDGDSSQMATATSGATGTVAAPADTTSPSITFDMVSFVDTGVQGDQITDNPAVTFSGTVSDNVGVASVQVFNGSTSLGFATIDNVAHTWTLSTMLQDGNYTQLHATATDTSNITRDASTSGSVTVNPAPVTITIDTPNGFSLQTPDPLSQMGQADFQSATTTQLTLINAAADRKFVVDGMNFTFDGNGPTGGSVTGFSIYDNATGQKLADVNGLPDVSLPELAAATQAISQGNNSSLWNSLSANWVPSFVGNSGPDAFEAGGGTLTGNGGADRFMYSNGDGAVTITDFTQSQGDKIDLTWIPTIQSLTDVLTLAQQSGFGTVINFGNMTL